MEARKLAFLSGGLGALGLAFLIIGLAGDASSGSTYELVEQEIHDITMQQTPPRNFRSREVREGHPEFQVLNALRSKGAKKFHTPKSQQLKLDFAGETPISDDDFDAAGYNMEGVWDWKLGRFRSPKFVHKPEIEAYEDEDGGKLEIPECTPDESLPKATVYPDCGQWARIVWQWEPHCYHWYSWWSRRYYWWGCWRRVWQPAQMPSGGIELPMGYYSELGDKCYDDRPINIVKERTRREAAWLGGCELSGCIQPDACSALELPAGVNVQMFDGADFKGYTINFQGPVQIPCLVQYGWNDRLGSIKVQNSIGMDAEEPKPVDRIHNTDWIYPGGPDSSMSKYDPYFNQWDELDSSEYEWHPPSQNMDDPDMVNAEPWQADVNNLY
jgi:hypothetical protein